MTPIAPHISAFLRERLPLERQASEHTCDSYAYAFQLLFDFASKKLKVPPSALHLERSTCFPGSKVRIFMMASNGQRSNPGVPGKLGC